MTVVIQISSSFGFTMDEKSGLLQGHGNKNQNYSGEKMHPGQPPMQYPGNPGGQYPGQPANQYPGQPANQYPGQPANQYPGQPANQYPGQPANQYPGPAAGQYPGQPTSQPQGPYPGSYQGQPQGPYPGGPAPGAPPAQYPPQGAGQSNVNLQWKGEMPDQDIMDNPNAAPVAPSAPPLEKMDTVAGYDNVGFAGGMLPPPSYDEAMRQEQPERQAVTGLPKIQEDEAREALLHHVAEHCCYGKGAAQELSFRDLQHSSAFHYTLETFGEGRSTCWAYEPYSGQPIDGPQNGPAPGPWQIQAQPATMFKDQKTHVEVPHTASIKPCHNCLAMGRIRCHRCHGRGRVQYLSFAHWWEINDACHNDFCQMLDESWQSSRPQDWKPFTLLTELTRPRCHTCHGNGMITCNCCNGYCNLKCYIKLTIVWKNHVKDHIVERTALPDQLIRNVSGQVAFEEQQLRVWPINHFPDPEINTASQRIVQEHSAAFPSERILMQRHKVRIIPVTQAFYKWKGQDLDYFVYGFEKKVYAPSYPQQCCCGCNLL